MSSSNSRIIKDRAADMGAEPFVMERFTAPPPPEEKAAEGPPPEKVEDRIMALEREAYEKGFEAGEKAGFELGRQKAEVLFNGLSKVLEELSSFKETLFKPCEMEMVELSLAIAKKVIHSEVSLRKDLVLESVREAMKAVVAGGEITVKVNPKDLEVIQQYRSELSKYAEGVKGVHVEADDSIEKGGCVIGTNYGEVDATFPATMEEIEEKLKNA